MTVSILGSCYFKYRIFLKQTSKNELPLIHSSSSEQCSSTQFQVQYDPQLQQNLVRPQEGTALSQKPVDRGLIENHFDPFVG